MADSRFEPNCWVCKNFQKIQEVPSCAKHSIRIPTGTAALFVCTDFIHCADTSITIDGVVGVNIHPLLPGRLYTYRFMDTTPAAVVGEFDGIEKI